MAKAHSRHPANYLQDCTLCCRYVIAFAEERNAMIFWQEHLEYLHTVDNRTIILCDSDIPSYDLQVKVYGTIEEVKRVFDALYIISPDETSISVSDHVISLSISEPDILCNITDWNEEVEEEEEEDIRRQPLSASLSSTHHSLQGGRSLPELKCFNSNQTKNLSSL